MKPQQNEDLKVPDQYFDNVKLHWRNVLEIEDATNSKPSQLKNLSRKKIVLIFMTSVVLGVGAYFISSTFNENIANVSFTENLVESQQVEAIEYDNGGNVKLDIENAAVNANNLGHIQMGKINTGENVSRDNKEKEKKDSTFHNEMASLTPEEIETYLLNENPEVLVETIY